MERPSRLGGARIQYRDFASILTPATGFVGEYDFSLNPYSGCHFGCSYCYAAFFARDRERRDTWGDWVEVKQNAVQKLRSARRRLTGKRIYMSTVTDPYQGIEARLGLVRGILETLQAQQPRLVVQTRSPLVTRDIDLYERFEKVRIQMTVTTDSDRVRRAFEPRCPTTEVRLRAIEQVARRGIPASITLTPLLPVKDARAFARRLRETGIQDFVLQPFHPEKGRFVRGTRDEALALVEEFGWSAQRYREAREILRSELPSLREGRAGFRPA